MVEVAGTLSPFFYVKLWTRRNVVLLGLGRFTFHNAHLAIPPKRVVKVGRQLPDTERHQISDKLAWLLQSSFWGPLQISVTTAHRTSDSMQYTRFKKTLPANSATLTVIVVDCGKP